MELLAENPKIGWFIIGSVVTLIIMLIVWYMFGAAHFDEASGEMAYLFGGQAPSELGRAEHLVTDAALVRRANAGDIDPPQAAKDPAFFSMAMTDSNVNMDDSTPTPSRDEGSDDDAVTEHLISRGGARRAIVDSSRNRYQGMAALGANDYEGYVYQGEPVSDGPGPLAATVYEC